jgi:hypothetical protein
MAGMTDAEYEAYERAKMAEQDARGALEKAEEKGVARGEGRGQRPGCRLGKAGLPAWAGSRSSAGAWPISASWWESR